MINDFLHIDWEAFHFLRPNLLWLSMPLFVVLVIGVVSVRDQVKWKKAIAPHLRAYVIKRGSESIQLWMRLILVVFLGIGIIGASGPTWKKIEVPGQILETPVVIALDLSQSMMASDIQPNRLERAKFKISDLMDANPRARLALIGFAGTAHTIIPLARDYNIIKSHLDGLSPNIMPFPGSNLSAALKLSDSITAISDAPATLILFTDDFSDAIFQDLQQFVGSEKTRVEIVPMNTIAGGDVPVPGAKRPFKNQQGEIVHSSLNTEIVSKLNSIENIHVNQLTLDNSDMVALAKTISQNLKFQEEENEKKDDWIDYGLWLVIPLALFVLMWFRRGFVVYSVLIVGGLSACDSKITIKNLWLTQDYQAQKQYDKGQYSQAAELFTDPLRRGVAYFKAGNYEEAIEAFEMDTTANGAYNLGLAYYKNGDLAAAELAFGKAVELNPDLKDAQENQAMLQNMIAGTDEVDPKEAEEANAEEPQKNIENKDMEDLGGGGQEATEEDMEKERKEETVTTDMRKGKELDEVPDDFEAGSQDNSQKVLMRKVDDDPALFLKRKFAFQAKKYGLNPPKESEKW